MNPFASGWVCILILMFATAPVSRAFDADFRMANRWINSILFPPGSDDSDPDNRSWDANDTTPTDSDDRSEEAIMALENRLIVDGALIGRLDYSAHILTTVDYATRAGQSLSGVAFEGRSSGFFRNPDLQWDWKEIESGSDRLAGTTEFDRLLLEWRSGSTTISAGRQAIGLSSCFYLTINDFFEPIAAEAVYREYKPGVDSLYVRHYPGALSEIDLIGVAGTDSAGDIEWNESALIARTVFTAAGFQWTLMGGKLPYRMMAGGGFQGESGRIGVRAEANVNFPQDRYDMAFGAIDTGTYLQASGGVDMRFENSLHVFAEYLYRGNGYGNFADYLASVAAAGSVREAYSARNYAVLAATYQWHPLLTGQVFGLVNLDDESAMLSLVATYSLADEADLAFGGYLPMGDEPEIWFGAPVPQSQYGTSDAIAYLELRLYF